MKKNVKPILVLEDFLPVDVLLRPMTHVPSREAWLHQNPATLAKVRKGLSKAKSAKVEKVPDLERFFDSL